MTRIAEVRVVPLDVELTEPFGIATGAQLRAENALVTIVPDDGSVGLGEAAPFPAVNAERTAAIAAVEAASSGSSAPCRGAGGVLPVPRRAHSRSTERRCAVETALLDALCGSAGLSLWAFFGGSELSPDRHHDPGGDVAHAVASAKRAIEAGFDTLKVKVGAGSVDDDARRVRARLPSFARAAPRARCQRQPERGSGAGAAVGAR
jgi:L-alanine-DL-glutamate epimerase-like enolase superfamily enzyme